MPGCRGGSACAECRGGKPLLRCPEVENLGPGKVDACVNLYWVLLDADSRKCGSFAMADLSGQREKTLKNCKGVVEEKSQSNQLN